MFTNTDRGNQKDIFSLCGKTNRTKLNTSTFNQSIQVGEKYVRNTRLLSTDYGTKWIQVMDQVNPNSYGYSKESDPWIDVKPPISDSSNRV